MVPLPVYAVDCFTENVGKAGHVCLEATTEMAFVYVPDGCFKMGSPEKDMERGNNEDPAHKVCIDGFWMGQFEVTNTQYRRFKPDHSSRDFDGYSLNRTKQPVVYVNWNEADAYAAWLSEQAGGIYRLPTEAEWEYAARAGSTKARFWGSRADAACRYANVADRTGKKVFPWMTSHRCYDGVRSTAPVGRYLPNAFGLHDMLGNVWEWTADWFGEKYYAKSPRNNPKGPAHGRAKTLRGGGWSNGPDLVRSAFRRRHGPKYRHNYIGFRLMRESGSTTPIKQGDAP
ncbi:MAG: formylglycine-generating enzyme family protein [Magnetococcales bacterium]|nr:formylglycine-generating enzyme family protein [Magnetococcales bacterium]